MYSLWIARHKLNLNGNNISEARLSITFPMRLLTLHKRENSTTKPMTGRSLFLNMLTPEKKKINYQNILQVGASGDIVVQMLKLCNHVKARTTRRTKDLRKFEKI